MGVTLFYNADCPDCARQAKRHIAAEVPNTALQQVFIVIVATFGPLAAVLVAWRRSLRLGAGLFAAQARLLAALVT